MGKKHSAKTGGAAVLSKKFLEKKVGKVAAKTVDSDVESDESGNFVAFNKKRKDSDDEEDGQEVFNLALDRDDEDDEVVVLDYLFFAQYASLGMKST